MIVNSSDPYDPYIINSFIDNFNNLPEEGKIQFLEQAVENENLSKDELVSLALKSLEIVFLIFKSEKLYTTLNDENVVQILEKRLEQNLITSDTLTELALDNLKLASVIFENEKLYKALNEEQIAQTWEKHSSQLTELAQKKPDVVLSILKNEELLNQLTQEEYAQSLEILLRNGSLNSSQLVELAKENVSLFSTIFKSNNLRKALSREQILEILKYVSPHEIKEYALKDVWSAHFILDKSDIFLQYFKLDGDYLVQLTQSSKEDKGIIIKILLQETLYKELTLINLKNIAEIYGIEIPPEYDKDHALGHLSRNLVPPVVSPTFPNRSSFI